ncbi:MAG: VanW family protein [Clostridia bacterium]|nr:VanW family protein [Clostridia bacterium]
MKKTKSKTSKKSSILWLAVVSIIAVGLLLFCQFFFGDTISDSTTYFDNTFINGVDVSGMTKAQAENLISTKTLERKKDINLTLTSGDKKWSISGDDLEVVANFNPTLSSVMQYGREGNVFAKKQAESKIKSEGLYVDVPFEDIYGGLDQKIDKISAEIESDEVAQTISFAPDATQMFSVMGNVGRKIVDRAELKKQINLALNGQIDQAIEIPTQEVLPEISLQDFVDSIVLRGKFETDFSKSTSDRKSNISLALSKFNGMIVEPQQTVSFNQTTGNRTSDNGYKNAKIIVGGKYVAGMGGGVCQASTTLYNALLRSDVEILQVCHHTLPASYVPLSFDAMVSEGYADLVFKNSLDTPIFIKAYTTEKSAVVEVYGQPFEEGLSIGTRAELVKILPHGGDDIITDTSGEYENQVLYKGEYYRLKYPLEGYESKGYLRYYKDGILTEEKQIRHDHYMPQNGIIVEGNASLEEGMKLPSNNVKYIPPQKVLQSTIDAAKARYNMT